MDKTCYLEVSVDPEQIDRELIGVETDDEGILEFLKFLLGNSLDREGIANTVSGICREIYQTRKTIEMVFLKDSPRSNYCLEDILKPGKLWDE
ncbi:MAG: hypothetical protein AB2L12_13685 [Smithellaceae bacterium]|jgi:hypothetical protein